MKLLSIAAILLTYDDLLYAQDALMIDQSGNVGIGTTAPHAPLAVMQNVSGLLTGLQFSGQHTPNDTAGGVINAYDADGKTVRHLTLQSNGGNIGVGTTKPNSTLDIRGRISVQQLIFTDADGNWYPDNWIGMADNVEEKKPWLHIGGITDKRKKENAKTGSVDGDGKRRIALWADTTKVGGELNVQGTIEANALQVKQRLETIGRLQVDDNAETTYKVTDRYHLSLSSKYLGRTKTIPQDILVALCGDPDGCQIRIGMTRWGNEKQIAAASRSFLFYYSNESGYWRSDDSQYAEGIDGDGTSKHVINVSNWNACFFTDAIYENGQDKGDKEKGMQLLWWSTKDYDKDFRTCELTLID